MSAYFVLDKMAQILNKINVMRKVLFILAVILTSAALAGSALAAPKILTREGSLVIETQGTKSAKKNAGSEDTLYNLLGKEVQVYIFNKKTRVWPQVYSNSGQTPFRAAPSMQNPQLEALISKYAQIYGVDPTLVRAVMRHESGFKSTAVSPKGAQGLMQLMPGTAALMGVKDPFDPEQNIAGGVGYLRHCLDRFQHNVPLAVAAYNAGPGKRGQMRGHSALPGDPGLCQERHGGLCRADPDESRRPGRPQGALPCPSESRQITPKGLQAGGPGGGKNS